MALLRGIVLVYKNPQSHRFVGVQNKSECLGIIRESRYFGRPLRKKSATG